MRNMNLDNVKIYSTVTQFCKRLFLIVLLALPTVSYAGDFSKGNITQLELAILQKLSSRDLGAYIKIDGLWGPASRKALAKFAQRNELPYNGKAMINELKTRNIERRKFINEPELIEHIRKGVSYDLLDPFSSKIRNV